MKHIFKALVIDDEESRNPEYQRILSDKFDVEIINDATDVTDTMISGFDLVVMDVGLSKHCADDLNAFTLMDQLNISVPVVLVSSQWTKNDAPSEWVLKVPNYKNVIRLYHWNQFIDPKECERIQEEIYVYFCKMRRIEMNNKSEGDDFVILHISDPQFGGNISGSACNDNARIVNYLVENEIHPDIIVISGDIADKAKKSEYDEAKKWIEELAAGFWSRDGRLRDEERKRIIFAPGNHDYDVSVGAADKYTLEFGASEEGSFVERDKVDYTIHQKNGFSNFIDFSLRLSKDPSWFYYLDRALHVNDRYVNYGINFLTLNSVYKINSSNCENKFGHFYCDLSKTSDRELKESVDRRSLINVLIMHNAPENFRENNTDGETSWQRFQTIIQDNKINLCLYGHTHDYRPPYLLRDAGGAYCKDLICIPAPTVRLAAASRTEDASRGFNIVRIAQNNFEETEVEVINYEMKKGEIDEVESTPFKVNNNKQK